MSPTGGGTNLLGSPIGCIFVCKCSACSICRTLLYFNLTAAVGPPPVYHKSLRTHIYILSIRRRQHVAARLGRAAIQGVLAAQSDGEEQTFSNGAPSAFTAEEQWQSLSIHNSGVRSALPEPFQSRHAAEPATRTRAEGSPLGCGAARAYVHNSQHGWHFLRSRQPRDSCKRPHSNTTTSTGN